MIRTWAIAIMKSSSNEPVLYYNVVRNKWVNDFQGGCAFFNEKSAQSKLNQLDIDGARVVKGLVH